MAVFTQVVPEDLVEILLRFDLGSVTALQGISSGIENTNYFLDTALNGVTSRWVLTVFENMQTTELPFFVALTAHLASKGLQVPAPCMDKSGQALFQLHGKDAMIVPCFSGRAETDMSLGACRQAGQWLAKMHLAVNDFDPSRSSVRNLAWLQTQLCTLESSPCPVDDIALLKASIARYHQHENAMAACPQGVVHGDLFRDNVLFGLGEISGVIDFYHACEEGFLFDLAVAANDWASRKDGSHDPEKLIALMSGYQIERPWTEQEHNAWPYFLELAALRFWVSRLVSKYAGGYQQESMAGETIKDPDEMRRIMTHIADY